MNLKFLRTKAPLLVILGEIEGYFITRIEYPASSIELWVIGVVFDLDFGEPSRTEAQTERKTVYFSSFSLAQGAKSPDLICSRIPAISL